MRSEDMLPPAVADLIRQIQDSSMNQFARDNIMTRLRIIEQSCRSALKHYSKERLKIQGTKKAFGKKRAARL